MNNDDSATELSEGAPGEGEIAFDYLKAPDFRIIRADGGIGGLTPHGFVHLCLYSERYAVPRRQVFAISSIAGNKAGTLGEEVARKRISRGSIVRQMDCDLFLTPDVARNLGSWLLERAEEADRAADAAKGLEEEGENL